MWGREEEWVEGLRRELRGGEWVKVGCWGGGDWVGIRGRDQSKAELVWRKGRGMVEGVG